MIAIPLPGSAAVRFRLRQDTSSKNQNPECYRDRAYALLYMKKYMKAEVEFSAAIQLVDQTDEIAAHRAEFESTGLLIRGAAHNAKLLSYGRLGRGHARACLGNWAGAEEDYKAVIAYAADDEEVERATTVVERG